MPENAHSAENGSAPYYARLSDGTRVEIIRAARAAGSENLPDTSAHEPDDVEGAVIQEHERQHRDALQHARGVLRELTETFDRIEHGLPAPRDLETLVEVSSADIVRERSNTHDLVTLHREQSRRLRDLNHLRSELGLVRGAIYPASRLHHFAMLAPLLLLEAVANAGFFSIGNDHGWSGGFGIAFFTSLINITMGATTGFFPFRWRRHPETRLQRIASTGIALYILSAIAFNFGVARFRDLYATAGMSQTIGLHQLLSPTSGISLTSAALLLVGLLASGISCWKGFRADDSTPGHGDCDREFRRTDKALREGRERHHRQILAHVESITEGCRAVVRRRTEGLHQLGELAGRAERCAEGYDVGRESAQRWCRVWLKKYRVTNVRVRTTPAPPHFESYPEFPHQLDASVVHLLRERLERNVQCLEELKAAAHRIELGQPERMRDAQQAFEAQWADVVRRADARHGDGAVAESPTVGAVAEVSRV
jgi:hypothetical protein